MKHRALLLFFSKKRQLVSPSLLGFLSPGNGGTEGGVKTIEDGRGSVFLLFKISSKKIVYETLEYYSQNIKTKKTLTRCETR